MKNAVQRMFVQAASNECAAVHCEPEEVEDKKTATDSSSPTPGAA